MVGQKPAKNLDATSNFMKWVDNIVPNTFHLRGGEAGVRDQVESDANVLLNAPSNTKMESESEDNSSDIAINTGTGVTLTPSTYEKPASVFKSENEPATFEKGAPLTTPELMSTTPRGRGLSQAPVVIGGNNMLDEVQEANTLTPTQIRLMAKLNPSNGTTDLAIKKEKTSAEQEGYVNAKESASIGKAALDIPSHAMDKFAVPDTIPETSADKPTNVMSFFDDKINQMANVSTQNEQASETAEESKCATLKIEPAPQPESAYATKEFTHVPEESIPATKKSAPMPEKAVSSFSVANLLELHNVPNDPVLKRENPSSTSLNPKAESFVSGSDIDPEAFPSKSPTQPFYPVSSEERRELTQWLRLTPAEARAIARSQHRPLPDESKDARSRNRMVVLSNLPIGNIDYKFVQKLVRGTIESITVSREQRVARIWFTTSEDSMKFLELHKAGIKIVYDGEEWTIVVQDGKDHNPMDPVVQAYIDCGATRVLQARNIHDGTTARALYSFVKEDEVIQDFEDIADYIEGGSVRVTVFTLASIAGAVKLRTKFLANPEYWATQDFRFLPDPCAAAASISL